jgi:hypothetical protein
VWRSPTTGVWQGKGLVALLALLCRRPVRRRGRGQARNTTNPTLPHNPARIPLDETHHCVKTSDPAMRQLQRMLWRAEANGAWAPLIGAPDKRVFVASNMKSSTESDPTKYDYRPEGANFTEQYQWLPNCLSCLIFLSSLFKCCAVACSSSGRCADQRYPNTHNAFASTRSRGAGCRRGGPGR